MTIIDTLSNGDFDFALVDKVLARASAARRACRDAPAHIRLTRRDALSFRGFGAGLARLIVDL